MLLDFDKNVVVSFFPLHVKSCRSQSWKGEVTSWDNTCQVESSRSSDHEPDSSSVNALGHSLAKWSYSLHLKHALGHSLAKWSYSLHLKHLSLSLFVLTLELDLGLVVDLFSLFLSQDSVLDFVLPLYC